MSGNDTSTQSVNQVSQPWTAAQPYLQDIMSQAQGLYNQGSSYAPFNTVAPFSPETEMGLQLTADRAVNGSPTINSANGALQQLMQSRTAPGSDALTGLLNGYNDQGTPGLQQTASGAMLNSNPYLDKMFASASRPVIDAVNAQFSQAGRTGSSANQDVLTRDLGDLAGNIYGQNYANERNLQQGAQTALSANSANQARTIGDAANSLNAQFNTGGQQALTAAGLAPSIAGQDYTDLQNLLSVGGARDSQAQAQIQDLLSRWQYGQDQPWSLLSKYAGAVNGLGSLGGTTSGTTTAKTPNTSTPSLIGGGMSLIGSLLQGGVLQSLFGG